MNGLIDTKYNELPTRYTPSTAPRLHTGSWHAWFWTPLLTVKVEISSVERAPKTHVRNSA